MTDVPIRIGTDAIIAAGQVIVESWELPIQNMAADLVTHSGGAILEIGFGMGMAAERIAAASIDEHIIIEVQPSIAALALQRHSRLKGAVLIRGDWKHVLHLLPKKYFMGILFDAYELTGIPHHYSAQEAFATVKPFLEAACSLLTNTGRVCFIDMSGSLGHLPDWLALLAKNGWNSTEHEVEQSLTRCFPMHVRPRVFTVTSILT